MVETTERPGEGPTTVDRGIDRFQVAMLGDPHYVRRGEPDPVGGIGADPLSRTVTTRSPSNLARTVTSIETSTTAVVQPKRPIASTNSVPRRRSTSPAGA